MPSLPTVKLVHRKDPTRTRIVNATDYARNIGSYKDWKIRSNRDGTATEQEVKAAATESKIEQHRKTDAARERKFGTHERARKARSSTANIVTESPAETPEAEEDAPVELQDWTKMKWTDACKHIREVTGKYPRTKKQAAEFVKEYEAAQ